MSTLRDGRSVYVGTGPATERLATRGLAGPSSWSLRVGSFRNLGFRSSGGTVYRLPTIILPSEALTGRPSTSRITYGSPRRQQVTIRVRRVAATREKSTCRRSAQARSRDKDGRTPRLTLRLTQSLGQELGQHRTKELVCNREMLRKPRSIDLLVERTTGFEPATPTLAKALGLFTAVRPGSSRQVSPLRRLCSDASGRGRTGVNRESLLQNLVQTRCLPSAHSRSTPWLSLHPYGVGGWVIRDQLEALGWDAREATDHAALACYVGQHADGACEAQLEHGRRTSATGGLDVRVPRHPLISRSRMSPRTMESPRGSLRHPHPY
jgi:hypothetical protein